MSCRKMRERAGICMKSCCVVHVSGEWISPPTLIELVKRQTLDFLKGTSDKRVTTKPLRAQTTRGVSGIGRDTELRQQMSRHQQLTSPTFGSRKVVVAEKPFSLLQKAKLPSCPAIERRPASRHEDSSRFPFSLLDSSDSTGKGEFGELSEPETNFTDGRGAEL